ncbi:MAG: membrane protein insertion efficiency factor YidD [Candidatus Kerfeldbacteria bacterium]|nr:membrane protein insertion efficiency factor YidD [Candidatus Kerfeldbacteria bacterium]
MTQFSIFLRLFVLKSIKLYQHTISPDHGWWSSVTRHACRYLPTCSEYAYGAVERYGVARGVALGCWRILRCNPLSRGGYDPVPDSTHK